MLSQLIPYGMMQAQGFPHSGGLRARRVAGRPGDNTIEISERIRKIVDHGEDHQELAAIAGVELWASDL